MSAWQMRCSSASKQQPLMRSIQRPARSNSSDNLRRSGIPLARQSRTPLKSETPRRSSIARSFSRNRLSMSTPLSRQDGKSPNRLKMMYTKVDEISYLQKIKQYIMKHSNTLEISKPVKITDFVGITQLFLTELCGPSYTSLTTANYKTEIPLRMKLLQYPLGITQSFLKSPNTSQNFQHVLSIWAFLIDLVDECSGHWEAMDEITAVMIRYVHNSYEHNVEKLQNELEEAIYNLKGVNKQELLKQKKEINDVIDSLLEQEAGASNRLDEQEAVYNEKVAEENNLLEQDIKRSEQLNILKTDLQTAEAELQLNKDKREMLARSVTEKSELVKDIDYKIKQIGRTPEELKAMENDLEKKERRYELLNSRFEESQERCRLVEQQIIKEKADMEKIIFEFNTKVSLDLPEHQRDELYLNENEVNEEQVLSVGMKIKELLSLAEIDLKERDEVLTQRSNENVELDKDLEMMKECVLERQQVLTEKNNKLELLNQKLENLQESQMQLDSEVNEIQELLQKSKERNAVVKAAYISRKEDSTKILEQMKEECMKTLDVVKERKLELLQRREDAHAAVKEMLSEARQQIPKFK